MAAIPYHRSGSAGQKAAPARARERATAGAVGREPPRRRGRAGPIALVVEPEDRRAGLRQRRDDIAAVRHAHHLRLGRNPGAVEEEAADRAQRFIGDDRHIGMIPEEGDALRPRRRQPFRSRREAVGVARAKLGADRRQLGERHR